jgi:hypothetical protein
MICEDAFEATIEVVVESEVSSLNGDETQTHLAMTRSQS